MEEQEKQQLMLEAQGICDEIDIMMKEDEKLGRKKVDFVITSTSKKTSELVSA